VLAGTSVVLMTNCRCCRCRLLPTLLLPVLLLLLALLLAPAAPFRC